MAPKSARPFETQDLSTYELDETPFFDVKRWKLPASHVRESHRGTGSEMAQLTLALNQYIPKGETGKSSGLDNPVFICAAGIGIAKELFEATFEDLTLQCRRVGIEPRSFFIADPVFMGDSALLNARQHSNDVLWFDHARDLLFAIDLLGAKGEMAVPLVGLGHSMGGGIITYLSLLHPNLFHTLLLVEPSISRNMSLTAQSTMMRGMLKRPNDYESLEAARRSILDSPFYASWDERVRRRLLESSFVPKDGGHPDGPQIRKTSGNMEAALMLKPNLENKGNAEVTSLSVEEREAMPLYDPEAPVHFPWYRSEPITVLKALPNVRPSVCYIIGGASTTSDPELREERLSRTGTGVGGSGGVALGRVVQHTIEGGGHFVLFEKKHHESVVQIMVDWLQKEMARWQARREADREWFAKSEQDKTRFDPTLTEAILEWHPKNGPNVAEIAKIKLNGLEKDSKL